MKTYKFILAFLLFVAQSLLAQNENILKDLSRPSLSDGSVVIVADSLIDSLIHLQQEVNLQKGGVEGFRIQLYRGTDVNTVRQEALKIKAMVLEKLPDAVVDEEYDRPVWYVRMGAFIRYSDALKMRTELERHLPELRSNINIIPAIIKQN